VTSDHLHDRRSRRAVPYGQLVSFPRPLAQLTDGLEVRLGAAALSPPVPPPAPDQTDTVGLSPVHEDAANA
jgi:hypothetical protein